MSHLCWGNSRVINAVPFVKRAPLTPTNPWSDFFWIKLRSLCEQKALFDDQISRAACRGRQEAIRRPTRGWN